MAAQIEQLRRDTLKVAEQLKQAGQPELADLLAGSVGTHPTLAGIARRLGLPLLPLEPAEAPKRTRGTGLTLPTQELPKLQEDLLRQQTYDLLPLLVEPSANEKEVLRVKRGLVFLPMTPQSYVQVVAEHPEHFWHQELEYAQARPALRDYTPPVAVEVGLIKADLALPGSFNKPRAVALQMIEDYSRELGSEFPGFKAIMLPVTGYASADRAYSERNPRQVLLKNYFAWGLDDISLVYAARAGRYDPTRRFHVGDWNRHRGYPGLGAVPAVVKIATR